MDTTDTAAKAANDDTAKAADTPTPEPAPAPKPLDPVTRLSLVGILLFIAEQAGTATERATVIKRAQVFDQEERVLAAIEAGAAKGLLLVDLVGQEGQTPERRLTLTVDGWREVLATKEAAAMAALTKKDDELKAFRKRVSREHELAAEVQACEADVEASKAATAAAKERLAEANQRLAAFVRGDVQPTLFDDDSGHRSAYEQGYGAFDPAKAGAVNPYPADPQASAWQRGYDEAKAKHQPEENEEDEGEEQPAAEVKPAEEPAPWAGLELVAYQDKARHFAAADLEAIITPEGLLGEARRGEAVAVKEHIITAYERAYVVIARHGAAFLALPLYDKDEWAQLHEATYGRSVEGVDQTDEAKVHRQTGGEFCGRVVKMGRKKAVIGPMKDGLLIDTTPPAPAEPAPVEPAAEPAPTAEQPAAEPAAPGTADTDPPAAEAPTTDPPAAPGTEPAPQV